MLHAIIMAGGSGTRFWPASRRSSPKQFLTLASDTPLLRVTYERLEGLVPPDRAAEIARDNDVVVYTIAIGDPAAVGEQQLDEKTLRNIAATTSGAYFHANDRQELEAIYGHLDEINPRQVETQQYRPVTDLFSWPLSAAVLLTILYLAYFETRVRHAARTQANTASAAGVK